MLDIPPGVIDKMYEVTSSNGQGEYVRTCKSMCICISLSPLYVLEAPSYIYKKHTGIKRYCT